MLPPQAGLIIGRVNVRFAGERAMGSVVILNAINTNIYCGPHQSRTLRSYDSSVSRVIYTIRVSSNYCVDVDDSNMHVTGKCTCLMCLRKSELPILCSYAYVLT